jgi:ankyrin repeat protein
MIGANLKAVDHLGNNCLHYALGSSFAATMMEHGFVVVGSLLDHGADPNHVNNLGNTPLHIASENELSVVACLIAAQKVTNVNVRNKRGQTALHLAVRHWKLDLQSSYNPEFPLQANDLVITLLRRGADLKIKGNKRD